MKETKNLLACTEIAELYPYCKADVFSGCLIEAGFEPEQVIISRKDGLGQGFLYNIERVSVKYPYVYPENPFLNIESGRPGIYDSLPEDLFYAPDHSGQERDKSHILRRMRANKEVELAVRRFLHFFEVEADSFLYGIRFEELKYDKQHTYCEFISIFKRHWEVIPFMSMYEALRFLKVIPYIYSLRSNYKAGAEAISFILNVSIGFKQIDLLEKNDRNDFPSLSEMVLADNSILAPNEDESLIPTVLITVSDMDMEACTHFFDGKEKEQVLRYLAELFLEVNTSIEIEIIPKAECQEFFIGDPAQDAYLGVNTYL